jgi:hypothetical protein
MAEPLGSVELWLKNPALIRSLIVQTVALSHSTGLLYGIDMENSK